MMKLYMMKLQIERHAMLKTGRMILTTVLLILANHTFAQRQMENLGRGVVAMRSSTDSVFISWRMLGTDPSDIGFNLYRSTGGGMPVKLNSAVITKNTNYSDVKPDFTKENDYF